MEGLVNNGYNIIGFLPVYISEYNADQDDIADDMLICFSAYTSRTGPWWWRPTTISKWRVGAEIVPQNDLSCAIYFLRRINDKGFTVNANNSGMWNFFLTLIPYCCDIVESKHVSAVKHGLSNMRPCHRFVARITDFETMDKCDMRYR